MKLKFLKNALILTASGFILRGLGMLFRVYISSRVGEEGMGVYQLISSAYFLFITLAQSGLAVTVTRLCAKRMALCGRGEGSRVLKSGIVIALFTGIFACVLMFFLSDIVSRLWINDMRAVMPLRALSLSLPFISVCGVISGYFTANKNVTFGCLAQIIEQISRLAAAAVGVWLTAGKGIGAMLTAVVFANTLSEAVSCGYLGLCYLLSEKSPEMSKRTYKREIVRGAVPVAFTRYLVSGLHTAENMLVPSAITLFTGSRSLALSQFGALKGMALPLLFFPFSFISALSTLLVPEITQAKASGDKKAVESIVKRTCGITLLLSAMAGGAFFLFADSFGMLIYNSEKVVMMIRVLAPIVPFMYLDSICDGLLKGLGKQKQVFYNNCIDSALRIVFIILLVPRFGIYGFLAVMFISNITVSLLNFRILLRASGVKCDFTGWWLLPFTLAALSAIITKFLMPFGTTLTKTILGCLLFCLIFATFSLVFLQKSKKSKNN